MTCRCVVLPRHAVASPHWVCIGLYLLHPNHSGSTTAASIETQWGDATARRGSTTLVPASLRVCSQPETFSLTGFLSTSGSDQGATAITSNVFPVATPEGVRSSGGPRCSCLTLSYIARSVLQVSLDGAGACACAGLPWGSWHAMERLPELRVWL